MTTEQPENTSLVASLISQFEAQIATLQAAIASLRAVQAGGTIGSTASSQVSGAAIPASSAAAIDLPEGAFKNKSIPQCIELYLSTVGMKKKTNQEIADALKEGGVESTGDLGNSVTGALFKLKTLGKILRFKDGWGLANNYPAHIRGAAPAGTPKRAKKKGKTKKGKSHTPQANTEPPAATVTAPKKPVNDRIIDALRSNKKAEYTLADIGEHIGMGIFGTRLNVSKLVKAGKVEKTPNETYRIPIPRLVAAAVQ
jgi:hypothetical protein